MFISTLKSCRGRGARLLALLLAPAFASAEPGVESHQAILSAAKAFLSEQVSTDFTGHHVTLSTLDPRLRLSACERPLQGFLPAGREPWGNTTVGVRCPGAKPWTVYVPATVKGLRPVVVLKRPVVRGAAITAQDIALEEREVTDRPDRYMPDPAHAVGMIAKRALAADTSLSVSMLDAPLLVHRGQQITILAQAAGLEVRMAGTALGDGAAGELVRAKNTVSKRIIQGLVVRPGVIRVTM